MLRCVIGTLIYICFFVFVLLSVCSTVCFLFYFDSFVWCLILILTSCLSPCPSSPRLTRTLRYIRPLCAAHMWVFSVSKLLVPGAGCTRFQKSSSVLTDEGESVVFNLEADQIHEGVSGAE